jgi:hypothetical protein
VLLQSATHLLVESSAHGVVPVELLQAATQALPEDSSA